MALEYSFWEARNWGESLSLPDKAAKNSFEAPRVNASELQGISGKAGIDR